MGCTDVRCVTRPANSRPCLFPQIPDRVIAKPVHAAAQAVEGVVVEAFGEAAVTLTVGLRNRADLSKIFKKLPDPLSMLTGVANTACFLGIRIGPDRCHTIDVARELCSPKKPGCP
jgi:hypothetical protein